MSENESEFDALVKLHTEIKSFKIDKSEEILKNFHSEKQLKFKLTAEEKEEKPRLNLSSTTVCTYALSQYFELWDEVGRSEYKSEFGSIKEHYEFIIKGLEKYLESKLNNISKLESPDEFSLLNMLPLLKQIQEEIKKENNDSKEDNEVVIRIIRMLCKQFFKNKFSSFGERPHPFIYYKFMQIIQDWTPEIFNDIKDHKNEWTSQKKKDWELKYFVDVIEKKGSKAIFDYFFSEAKIYDDAKYEMYRQIALYNAADMSLFDVKRLIYSLLIVKMNDKYSNNLIKDKVLKLIFEVQLDTNTGLFPVGHVVNTDFVIEGGEIVYKTERIISASPMLSSVECLEDMLTHKELKADLEKYHEKLNSTYEWIIKRLRKDSSGKPLGWFPEYESKHTAESWVAGYTLVFLKKYCEMLSDLIKKSADKYLQAKKPGELDIDIPWDKLCDSYNVKEYIGRMMQKDKGVSNPDYRSALIFGPPGSGKSAIAKALAEKLRWDYVELTPGLFLSEGEQKIISKANEIFKRLARMKGAVVFFDEVDQLVELRKEGTASSKWIVTALLPQFQKLRKQKEIKFILATNHIEKVDPAVTRSGRIDLVLPMGGTYWRDRLKILKDAIDAGNSQIKEKLKSEIFGAMWDKNIDNINKGRIKKNTLINFLKGTNFVPLHEVKRIAEEICSNESWEEVEKDELYDIFFKGCEENKVEAYKSSDFEKFNDNLLKENTVEYKHVRLPLRMQKGEKYTSVVKDNIFP